MNLTLEWDSKQTQFWTDTRIESAVKSSLLKAGNRALRDMKASSQKTVRTRKKLPVGRVNAAMGIFFPRGKQSIDSLQWRLDVSTKPVPLIQYPYRVSRRGVSVKVNAGGYKIIPHAFLAKMRSGHVGIFKRAFPGAPRLPIVEAKFSTRVSDVFKDHGMIPAIFARAQKTFSGDFIRLLPIELNRATRG